MSNPPFPDSPRAVLARFLRSQVALATVKPAGCVQINNAEAMLCAEALDGIAAAQLDAARALVLAGQHKGLCVECGARVVDNPGSSG